MISLVSALNKDCDDGVVTMEMLAGLNSIVMHYLILQAVTI